MVWRLVLRNEFFFGRVPKLVTSMGMVQCFVCLGFFSVARVKTLVISEEMGILRRADAPEKK